MQIRSIINVDDDEKFYSLTYLQPNSLKRFILFIQLSLYSRRMSHRIGWNCDLPKPFNIFLHSFANWVYKKLTSEDNKKQSGQNAIKQQGSPPLHL